MHKLIKDSIYNVEVYKPGKSGEDIRKNNARLEEVNLLASNENPLGPSPRAVHAIKKSLEEGSLYPDSNCRLLREKIGGYLGVSPGNICVGNGTTELILLIGLTFLNPDDVFIMSKSPSLWQK